LKVENEHCTNVGRARAQRDPALPYEVKHPELEEPESIEQPDGTVVPSTTASGRDIEAGPPSTRTAASSLRRRGRPEEAAESPVFRALMRVGTTFITAHAQDYEKKRRRPEEEEDRKEGGSDDDDDSE
jgi:xenotropic and polytropic retrovirus receptor 1